MKRVTSGTPNCDSGTPKKKMKKEFNFTLHPKRKIAIMFHYYGWEYDGLVQQTNTKQTVEELLMRALMKTKLIESWESCDFSRCGRTDKGVSAFKQVAACVVRSSDPAGEGVYWPSGVSDSIKSSYSSTGELNYLKMLNGCLPPSIRVNAWAPVTADFTARHACTQRVYKYSMPNANLNLEAMKDACSRFVGEHDFRNFCQVDMNEARVMMSYVREIFDVQLEPVPCVDPTSPYSLLELTVKGSGFLWHMIRYIVTVLHEVGCGNEKPEIVSDLLDVEKHPRRPQYTLAADTPLCLFDCSFDKHDLMWKYDAFVTQKNMANLQREWSEMITKCRVLENMMSSLSQNIEKDYMDYNPNRGLIEFIQAHPLQQIHLPFLLRPTCESLEEKREKLEKKKQNNV